MKYKFNRAYDIFETRDNKYLVVFYASKICIYNSLNFDKVTEFTELKNPA